MMPKRRKNHLECGTGQYTEARTADHGDNTTGAHHRPQTATQTRQHSYHSYTFQKPFTTKTNTIATPTASMTKKQKTSRALRGSSQNTIAATVRNSTEMIHITIIIDITVSHPPFCISPIKSLKIKIMVIPKTVIQVNKIPHWNPAATHSIIHLESVINPAVVAWMLTPPKTTV